MNDKDLLTIAKFSELTGIKQSVLRHYDEVGLFKPFIRDENGYRYYSVPQTIAVNLINVMHNASIPIKTIKEFIQHRSPEQILDLFHKQESELNRELLRLQQAYSIIHTYCGLIEEGLHVNEQEITIRSMPALPIELGPVNDFSSGTRYDSFFNFLMKMDERNINSAFPVGGFYKDMDSFTEGSGQPNRYFSCVPTGHDLKKAGEYLVGYTRGYYWHIGDLPERMHKYAKEQGLNFVGPVYEIYLLNEVVIEEPSQYLIQVSVPIKKRELSL